MKRRGEVCVRGPTVFQGYYKDDAQVGVAIYMYIHICVYIYVYTYMYNIYVYTCIYICIEFVHMYGYGNVYLLIVLVSLCVCLALAVFSSPSRMHALAHNSPSHTETRAQTREVIDAQGWLHTGDVGLWLPGGRLKIIDR